tara:strand:- start:12739 stop:13740 length:1002 start_codon:yes stop_codon:yes gene_type:complete
MKYLPLCLVLSVCVLISGTSSAQAENYNPLEKKKSRLQDPVDITIQDPGRQRDIPLRIFLPEQKQAAPVVLFSHGLGGSRNGSQYLGEHWSARGYVVVYLQHHGSDETVWKDAPARERLKALQGATTLQNSIDRYQDVSAVLDQLAGWNADAKHRFHQQFDLNRIGMSGHSFGAVTTQGVSGQSWRLIGKRYTDPRIKAAVMFSPSTQARSQPEQSFGEVSIPWMLLTGTKDTSPINATTVEDRRQVYQGLPDTIDKYELVLFDAQHSAFSDGRQRLGVPHRNPQHHPVILGVTTAFWDTYLKQNQDAGKWLQGKPCRQLIAPRDEWQFQKSR